MFSLIFLLNKNEIEINNYKKFMTKLSSTIKDQNNIELIFFIDTRNYKLIDLIQEFQDKNKNAIVKFIFSSKRIPFNKSMRNINKIITNDYFFILSPSILINDNFFDEISKVINSQSPDIIEFKPNIKGIIKWKPTDRLEESKFNALLKVNENSDVIAFTYPFIYNKVFSTSLLHKVFKNHFKESSGDFSNFLFNELIYIMFLNAKTYWYSPKSLIEIEINNAYTQGFNDVIGIWTKIQDDFSVKTDDFFDEIQYAKAFYLKVILSSIYSNQNSLKIKNLINKENLIQKKYYEKLLKIESNELKDFDLKNKYMLINDSKEANLMKHSHSISKWNKLLKELES